MIPLSLSELAEITGGRILSGDPDLRIDGPVVTDSRQAAAGSLYVARIGEQADGHAYVPGAAANGAVAALVTREIDELPAVLVEDVQVAFAALASEVVARQVRHAGLVVVGVTGSSGKTTTKDLLAYVIEGHLPTVANIGSLNSEVGVPLTVCRITPETRVLVLEMGARGVGHVDYLTTMTHPSIGIVLNVGSAHLGEFGSRETIARAKAELPAALPTDGLAVLNADDDLVRGMADVTGARVVLTGRSDGAQVRATDVALDATGAPSFTLHLDGGQYPVTMQLLGEHQVDNALAVVAAARHIGMSPEVIVERLATARPGSRWRMERTEREDGVVVVNDAYNANPESMNASLRTLGLMQRSGRAVVALGAMYELGPDSDEEHRRVGRLAAELGLDVVLAVGADAAPIADGAEQAEGHATRVLRADSIDAAQVMLEDELTPGDVVLLKSSHSAGLRHLGDRLTGQEDRS